MNRKNITIFAKTFLLFVAIGIIFDLIFDLNNLNIGEIISEIVSSIIFALYVTYVCKNSKLKISIDNVLINMSKFGTVIADTDECIEWKLKGLNGFYFNKAFYNKKTGELETSKIIIKKCTNLRVD